MNETLPWKITAKKEQVECFNYLGSRPYDEIMKSNLLLLIKKVGFGSCGSANELPKSSNYFTGYSQKELKDINRTCHQIIKLSDCDPIKLNCILLLLYQKGEKSKTTVFKIVSKSKCIFIDTHSRVYKDWDSFLKNNKLPPCEFCYPENGEYYENKTKSVHFAKSPACSLKSKAIDCIDTVGSVAGVGAGVVVAAGMFVTVAPVAATVAGITMFGTAGYSLLRSSFTLYDRKKHDQSIGLKDRESQSEWLSIASSTVGFATFKAVAQANKVRDAGKSLTKMASVGLHALSATSMTFSGYGFIQSALIFKDKYKDGTLTKKDIFDLSCELLFLFNAIACTKATAELVNNLSAVNIEQPQAQRKLTKSQKRNIRRRNAKKLAKGVSSTITIKNEKGVNIFKMCPLLLAGAKHLAPRLRLEEISFMYQTIAYDVVRWRNNEISFPVLIKNVSSHVYNLYNKYCEEISEIKKEVIAFVNSNKFDMVLSNFQKLFETASDEFKNIFCNKVISAEDEFENIICESEKEIIDLHTLLKLKTEYDSSESMDLISGNLDDVDTKNEITDVETRLELKTEFNSSEIDDVNEPSQETKTILSNCEKLIRINYWSCNDINDFGDIFDGVKCVIVSEFKHNVAQYMKSLEAAKSASGDSFDIETYHKTLKIDGDVSQHYFNEVLQRISDDTLLYKIKTNCQAIKKEIRLKTVPVWETANKGMFYFDGPTRAGYLDKRGILKIVRDSGILNSLNYCDWVKCDVNIKISMVAIKHEPGKHIIVYQDVDEENTSHGFIIVVT